MPKKSLLTQEARIKTLAASLWGLTLNDVVVHIESPPQGQFARVGNDEYGFYRSARSGNLLEEQLRELKHIRDIGVAIARAEAQYDRKAPEEKVLRLPGKSS